MFDHKKKTDDYNQKTCLTKKVRSVVAFLPILILIKTAVLMLQTAGKTFLTTVEKLLLRNKSGVKSSF